MVDMRVHLLIAALSAALGWMSLGAARPLPSDPTRLVVYGHSMPAGGGATSPDQGYAPDAAHQLGLPLVNRAHGGHRAIDALAVIEANPAPAASDLVVFHVGMNDLLLFGDLRDAEAVTDSMRRLTSTGARVLLVAECQPTTWEHAAPYDHGTQAAFTEWNQMLGDIAADDPDHVTLIDACATWNPSGMTDAAGFHPNDRGHGVIARAVTAAAQGSPTGRP